MLKPKTPARHWQFRDQGFLGRRLTLLPLIVLVQTAQAAPPNNPGEVQATVRRDALGRRRISFRNPNREYSTLAQRGDLVFAKRPGILPDWHLIVTRSANPELKGAARFDETRASGKPRLLPQTGAIVQRLVPKSLIGRREELVINQEKESPHEQRHAHVMERDGKLYGLDRDARLWFELDPRTGARKRVATERHKTRSLGDGLTAVRGRSMEPFNGVGPNSMLDVIIDTMLGTWHALTKNRRSIWFTVDATDNLVRKDHPYDHWNQVPIEYHRFKRAPGTDQIYGKEVHSKHWLGIDEMRRGTTNAGLRRFPSVLAPTTVNALLQE
jgi:hypothetical protein